MKKILLASGCSMTDSNYVSETNPEIDCSWPKWPELLAKKLDMECINLGRSGAGNEYIYSTLLEKILEKKDQIGLVMVGWTQCQRKDYQKWNIWKQTRFDSALAQARLISKEIDPLGNITYIKHGANGAGDVFGWLRKTLRYMISLQLVCERYNIPYKQFQMINLFDGWLNGLFKTDIQLYQNRNDPKYEFQYRYPGDKVKDRLKLQKILMEYESYINVKNFIGWPTTNSLGGFDIEKETIQKSQKELEELWHIIRNDKEKARKLIERGYEYQKELIVSDWDQHPNEKGQQKIAEFLYDRLG